MYALPSAISINHMIAAIDVRNPTNYPNKWSPMSDKKDPHFFTNCCYTTCIFSSNPHFHIKYSSKL